MADIKPMTNEEIVEVVEEVRELLRDDGEIDRDLIDRVRTKLQVERGGEIKPMRWYR